MLKNLMTRNTFLTLALLVLPAIAAAQSYSYDEVGRLVRAAYPQGGGVAYHYDEQDNMTAAIPLSLLAGAIGSGSVAVSRTPRHASAGSRALSAKGTSLNAEKANRASGNRLQFSMARLVRTSTKRWSQASIIPTGSRRSVRTVPPRLLSRRLFPDLVGLRFRKAASSTARASSKAVRSRRARSCRFSGKTWASA